MKKFFWIAVSVLTLAVVACNKYDDTELRNKISAMETRISTLESTVSGLQTIVSALQTGKRVTSVEKSGNAYVITFTDGSKATIESETIGIKADGDVYYWAINGDFLKDKDGNKIPVSAGGIVPVFRNNNGSLEVSTDNGKTWASVLVNEGNFSVEETDTTVTITVAGQKVVLYKDVPFTLNIQVPDGFSIEAGQTGELAYTISGVAEGVETEVGVLNEGKAFSAEVVPSSNQAGTIKITNMQADGSVKVIVYATDHMGKTDIKAILFTVIPAKPVEIVFEAVLDVQKVSADGGTCTLNVKADEDYTCTVEAAAQSWLTIGGTKAKHEDAITLSVAKNETTSQRSGTVTVASTTSDKKVNVVVLQEAGEAPVAAYTNYFGTWKSDKGSLVFDQYEGEEGPVNNALTFAYTGFGSVELAAPYSEQDDAIGFFFQAFFEEDDEDTGAHFVYIFAGLDSDNYIEFGGPDNDKMLAYTKKNADGTITIVGNEYEAVYDGTKYDEKIVALSIYAYCTKAGGSYKEGIYSFNDVEGIALPATFTKEGTKAITKAVGSSLTLCPTPLRVRTR